jgi:protocatechuate 3,4-dioxygenase beta subunit
MKRKDFLKKGFAALGLAAVAAPVIASCRKEAANGGTGSATSCVISPAETAGPFPTKNPASFLLKDIRNDRTGTPMTLNVTIQNISNNCAALEGALVDVWHCDKDGNYSEYGTQTAAHYLRGRQTTNSEGVAAFLTIFPGWYSGRAPHIHIEVFNASGKSLLVTQIAFPTEACDTVYTMVTDLYKKGKQDTSNTRDNIFSDSIKDELGAIKGSPSTGYTLEHTIKVKA